MTKPTDEQVEQVLRNAYHEGPPYMERDRAWVKFLWELVYEQGYEDGYADAKDFE